MKDRTMNRETAFDRINKAIVRAERHAAGDRDACLPDYMNPQVERFLNTLRQMLAAIANPANAKVPSKYMGMAVADGWPYESELGRLVCEAEVAFYSEVPNEMG